MANMNLKKCSTYLAIREMQAEIMRCNNTHLLKMGFPGGSDSKETACNERDLGSIPGLGRSLGEGKGYPLKYSCLNNSMDKGTWQATVHGVAND